MFLPNHHLHIKKILCFSLKLNIQIIKGKDCFIWKERNKLLNSFCENYLGSIIIDHLCETQ